MKNYTINEKISNSTNTRACHCILCGNDSPLLPKGTAHAVFIPSKGVRYVCDAHASNGAMLGYHGNASRRSMNVTDAIGTQKTTDLAHTTIGVELEIVYNGLSKEERDTIRATFERYFLVAAESDCTVSAEFPTERMEGLACISKVLQSIEKHGMISALNNERCGAHVHVQCNNVLYVRRFYHSIFCPLSDYIASLDSEYRVSVFGSDFRQWARPINESTDPQEHTNLFNTQHAHTLEFRLPRITSHKQYMNILKFWRECVVYINHFDFHENAELETRRAYAKQCGAQLVKIARKYF